MSKANKLREKFGAQIRESVGGGNESKPTVLDHPSRNLKFEGTSRAAGFTNIPLQKIEADEQHREHFDQEELEQLADSLNSKGLIAPIVVRWEQARKKYIIIAGERRFRAAKLCAWKEIKCDVKPDSISLGDIAEIQLAENLARKNLNAIEMAKAFHDVIEKNGYTARELSKKVGVNETTVIRYVRLLNLPPDLQSQVAAGKIPIAIAREAARLKGEGKQREFIKQATKEKYSTTDAQKIASGRNVKRNNPRRKRSGTTFETDYGIVSTHFDGVKVPTYEHIESMFEQALEEVRLRIRNRIRLKG